ncbi:MAG: DUF6527 family protein [Flavisolibacter sp.]
MICCKKLFRKYLSCARRNYRVTHSEDVPASIKPDTIYLVGTLGKEWLVVFCCPCACGEIIQLNLLKEAHPRWQFYIKKRKLYLNPSVWRKAGCKSHFFIKRSNVVWV